MSRKKSKSVVFRFPLAPSSHTDPVEEGAERVGHNPRVVAAELATAITGAMACEPQQMTGGA